MLPTLFSSVTRQAFYGICADMPVVPNLIDGKFIQSKATEFTNVVNPLTQQVMQKTPHSTQQEMNAAAASSKAAFNEWKHSPLMKRVRVMLDYQHVLKENQDKLAETLTLEHGKTFPDAQGSVLRGIEIVEWACSAPQTLKGEYLQHITQDFDSFQYRAPIGVTTAVCPSNFPGMIPLWTLPVSVVCGNSVIVKPSEVVPRTAMLAGELFQDVLKAHGAPAGLLNIIHGREEAVDFCCTHPDIASVSFVGGDQAGLHIHELGSKHGKRIQSNMAAKNHCIVTESIDNRQKVVDAIVGAYAGNCGQRCMALSVALFIGRAKEMIPDIVEASKSVVVGPGMEAGVGMGPAISQAHSTRIKNLITQAESEGATIALDGRNFENEWTKKYPQGNWVGPTVLTGVKPSQSTYQTEIFGPVLQCIEVDTYDEAVDLINANKYGNGTCLFTNNLAQTRHFYHNIDAGQIGINVPLPVSFLSYGFTGNKASHQGKNFFFGTEAFDFFTIKKTVSQLSRSEGINNPMAFPVLK